MPQVGARRAAATSPPLLLRPCPAALLRSGSTDFLICVSLLPAADIAAGLRFWGAAPFAHSSRLCRALCSFYFVPVSFCCGVRLPAATRNEPTLPYPATARTALTRSGSAGDAAGGRGAERSVPSCCLSASPPVLNRTSEPLHVGALRCAGFFLAGSIG